MYLKSLTIKGFKSFAQPTTFAFEPGVTCIVGPNGSGKSNVVDALAWVMGEQGAKTLRGGKMEDVIFAGTSTRGPLGRAQVLLTIDNADGLLPIEYSEVTISRTLFRNGGSEYAINGENCRLLDVQELLSDTGLGREMHVIVGQGQLDKVLHATPEDRRGFIEEAAGILKHRRRKEKTLRKLDAMQTNLTRLSDLAGEIRRQLKPLGRQAEVARKAQSVAAVARDAKARILADDVVRLRRELHEHQEVEAGRKSERIVLQERLDQTRARQQHVEQSMVGDDVDRARTVVHRLESVQERLRGLSSLANQRLMFLAQQADAPQQGPTITPEQVQGVRNEADRLEAQAAEMTGGTGVQGVPFALEGVQAVTEFVTRRLGRFLLLAGGLERGGQRVLVDALGRVRAEFGEGRSRPFGPLPRLG
ncbi:chromosome segregation SMC family protein, partial [Curtobacterium sp. CT11-45]|uniref:chromosome segregation SMC family protein n=1 Tax=Curtobacterium sp. CT11-45 TaxID=3243037 RepID=UPI0039B012CC